VKAAPAGELSRDRAVIVIDASAMVEALVGSAVGANPDADLLRQIEGEIVAPHLLDLEVLSVLRGLCLASKLTVSEADAARARYFAMEIDRRAVEPLQERIWALRHQFGSYDAAYIATAEGLKATLVTCDHKLESDAHTATVRVYGRSQ